MRRNCTFTEDYKKQALDLRDRFLDRGYPREVLNQAHKKALNSNRSDLLKPKTNNDTNVKTRIIGTFDDQANRVQSILRKYWGILKLYPMIIDEFIPAYPSITYRRGMSIGDHMVHSHYSRPNSDPTWLGIQSKKMVGMYSCGSAFVG